MASPDSPDAADAAVDGVLLTDLVQSLPLSRSSVFELLKVMAIKTTPGPSPSGKGRVAWVSSADADRLADAAGRVHRKEVRIADLAASLQRRQTPQTAILRSAAPSADSADSAAFLARLEAAERAIRSGLGLTTAEVTWVLGVRPGGDVVSRGGIRATRTARNCWRLQSAGSPDAA